MIKKYLEEHGESKTNDIAEHINLSPARTRALLKEIKEVQAMGEIVIGLINQKTICKQMQRVKGGR